MYAASVLLAEDEQGPRWPLITKQGLHAHLIGKVDNAQPFAHSSVLMAAEKADIVPACTDLNYHGCGFVRRVLSKRLLKSLDLLLRCYRNKHGRNYFRPVDRLLKAVHWPDLCVYIDQHHGTAQLSK